MKRTPKSSIKKKSKAPAIILVVVLLLIGLGVGLIFFFATKDSDIWPGSAERVEYPDPIYSTLTGLEISDANQNTQPTYCIQIPNGSTDGARPQVGLTQAAVVFEAIAETGITRFAAVFQNPTSSVIGPIRSLRPYYLDWDTPFDCTVVHAGGSDEALAAINRGGQRNLDENYTYMWRDNTPGRLWNNLFTSANNLANFSNNNNYKTSSPKVFSRLKPEQVLEILEANNCTNATSESCQNSYISNIKMNFSNFLAYNTQYTYDAKTNTYLRSYQTGEAHLVYTCPPNLAEPNLATSCTESQVAPSVVIAMIVQEHTMSDNYHENIQTTGSGKAFIFQNGQIVEGTWSKSSQKEQIVFKDQNGNIVSFAPGQIWIGAVPQFGSIDWDEITSDEYYIIEE